jgi:hypothetical protein
MSASGGVVGGRASADHVADPRHHGCDRRTRATRLHPVVKGQRQPSGPLRTPTLIRVRGVSSPRRHAQFPQFGIIWYVLDPAAPAARVYKRVGFLDL